MKTVKTNLNLYKSFVEVYETKNFSVAAANLGLTQPTISYNIKELEKQLKARLFNSNSRGVQPTKTADELYPPVRAAFIYLLEAESTIQEFNEKSQGVIRLNLSLYYMTQITTKFIMSFNKQYPNIKFEIVISSADDGLQSLDKHETDLLIYAYMQPQSESDEFATINLCELENSFYAGKEFARKHGLGPTITKQQLENLPIISSPKVYQTRTELEKIGLAKNPIIETRTTEMIISLMENNIGISLGLDEYLSQNKNLVRLEVEGMKPLKCHIAIKYNKNLANKAAAAFIEKIKKEYKPN